MLLYCYYSIKGFLLHRLTLNLCHVDKGEERERERSRGGAKGRGAGGGGGGGNHSYSSF